MGLGSCLPHTNEITQNCFSLLRCQTSCVSCCCSTISYLNVLVWNLTGQRYQDEVLQPVLVPSRHFLACIYAGVSYCICLGQAGLMCTDATTANDHCTAAGCSHRAIPQQQIQTLVQTMQTGDCFYHMQKRSQFELNIYLHVFQCWWHSCSPNHFNLLVHLMMLQYSKLCESVLSKTTT